MVEFIKGLFHKAPKNRIWELDALRGLCIIGVVIVHVVFDMTYFFNLGFKIPAWFEFIQNYGGILFVILSGICITLGHHNIVRGLIVAACAVVVSIATIIVGDPGVVIFWGILHLLAFCMLTYSLYRKLPWQAILAIAVVLIGVGIWMNRAVRVPVNYLFPIGLQPLDFYYGDYWPILPYAGFFMVGVVLGKTLYKKKETLFKKVNSQFFIIRFLSFCGRHSLLIYLIHQPLAMGVFYAVDFFKGLGSK